MPATTPNVRSIFDRALELTTEAERRTFLDEACAGAPAVRQQVEALLAADTAAGSFLETPASALATSIEQLRAPSHEAPSLGFLAPSGKPGALGRLGHYEVQEIIGSGAFGVVLKAHDEKLQRVVAIKTLAESLAASATGRRRFVREAQAAAAVRHNNVVGIFAVEEAGPVPYLVMELVDGISLEDKLQREGPLELKEVLRIGVQIADGLAAAHKQGLVHRDVKPANILLENGIQRVKITDFGLARGVDDASLTQTGLIAGTPSYMSPEQARGERVDARSDLFSLGSVLYALCTGQVPFPAGSSLGVAKKVCEETPRPIAELNPAIPPWLAEIVERLHAKDPARRFQSAEEVAGLLGNYLAQVQQASMGLPAIVTAHRSKKARELQRRWQPSPGVRRWLAVAVTALVLIGAMLGFTEAQGVTQLAATIIHIFTPEGTLVVEVDDPAVKVTVEGDGGLVVTGAGLHEVRLKPGKYQLRADKDGQRVPLSHELVTITRGDKELVRVSLETTPASAAPAPQAADGPFVVLRTVGKAVKEIGKNDTLAGAVLRSGDGDTIEIRGNGPFVCDPLLLSKSLVLRAGAGFRPVLTMTETGDQRQSLLHTTAPLVLEGLELQRYGRTERNGSGGSALTTSAPLRLANCRFKVRKHQSVNAYGVMAQTQWLEIRNCHFDLDWPSYAVRVDQANGGRITAEGNVFVGEGFGISLVGWKGEQEAVLRLTRNTFQGRAPLAFGVGNPQVWTPVGMLRVEASENVMSGNYCFVNWNGPATSAASDFRRLVRWHGKRNAYSPDLFLTPYVSPHLRRLAEWQDQWGIQETDSLQGPVHFQSDFRLAAESTGKGASEGGRDLGADLDLVGPGPSYERWKETPEYAAWLKDMGKWLKDIGKQRALAEPKPELGAFVVLGASGVAERKFATLGEAVEQSSEGDTIEIRGNGPFVTPQLTIATALTIRAGAGYRPLIQAAQGVESARPPHFVVARVPLTLEGLEFQGSISGGSECTFIVQDAPCFVANCRFSRCTLTVTRAPSYQVRNSHFSTTRSPSLIVFSFSSGPTQVVDNNLITNLLSASGLLGARIDIRRNLVMGTLGSIAVAASNRNREQLPVELHLSQNIFVGSPVLRFSEAASEPLRTTAASGAELEAVLRTVLHWQEDGNLYSEGARFFTLSCATGRTPGGGFVFTSVEPSRQYRTLSEWNEFWGQSNTGAVQGRVQLQGGDAVYSTPHTLETDAFRLRSDSAGYRGGPDGKDLGPDIDLVGPGEAYERWKMTPEYQKWLKETGQKK